RRVGQAGQDAHDDVGGARGDRGPADLGQRGRDADLVLGVEAEAAADLATGPPQRDDVGVGTELGDEEGRAHAASGPIGSTATHESSRRTARSRSSTPATTRGDRAARPGSSARDHRSVSPSLCMTTTSPASTGYVVSRSGRPRVPAMPGWLTRPRDREPWTVPETFPRPA